MIWNRIDEPKAKVINLNVKQTALTGRTKGDEDLGMFANQIFVFGDDRSKSSQQQVKKVVRCDGGKIPFEFAQNQHFPVLVGDWIFAGWMKQRGFD